MDNYKTVMRFIAGVAGVEVGTGGSNLFICLARGHHRFIRIGRVLFLFSSKPSLHITATASATEVGGAKGSCLANKGAYVRPRHGHFNSVPSVAIATADSCYRRSRERR